MLGVVWHAQLSLPGVLGKGGSPGWGQSGALTGTHAVYTRTCPARQVHPTNLPKWTQALKGVGQVTKGGQGTDEDSTGEQRERGRGDAQLLRGALPQTREGKRSDALIRPYMFNDLAVTNNTVVINVI